MTKSVAATTSLVTAAPAAQVNIDPNRVEITELSTIAWHAAISLVRYGWMVDTDHLPINHQATGYSTIWLVRQKPGSDVFGVSELALSIAAKAHQVAGESHHLAYLADVQNAATHLIAQEKKAAKDAELAAQLASQRAALAALEAAIKATEGTN